MNLKKKTMIMIAVIALLVVGSVSAIVYMKLQASDKGMIAYIYRDNEIIKTIDLSNVTEPYKLTIEYNENEFNVIEVRKNEIGIIEASCPDHLCVNMGFISDSLMPVTCLPNHLVIRVEVKGENSELDGMAY